MANIEQEILNYPLSVLKWSGQNPEQNKTKYFFITALYLVLASFHVVLTILQMIYANGDIFIIAQNIEAFVAVIQIIGKFVISAFKIEDFRKIINDIKIFWSAKTCTENVQIELENTMKRILQLEKLYIRMVIFTVTLLLSSPVFTKQLITGFWSMKGHNRLYTLALVIQEVVIAWSGIYTASYDCLFLGFCILLQAQFKMLHNSLKDLDVSVVFSKSDEKIYLNKLISFIQHHEFLLRFSKTIRDVYSPIMLLLYSSLLLLYCAEMYILFESKSLFQLIRHSLVMASTLLLFAFYCIPLNYVTDEAISVSQGIYESNWYSKHIASSKPLVTLIIQRSQQDITFMAGGLVEINCRTILNVIRMSYSVCTIMRAMKNV